MNYNSINELIKSAIKYEIEGIVRTEIEECNKRVENEIMCSLPKITNIIMERVDCEVNEKSITFTLKPKEA